MSQNRRGRPRYVIGYTRVSTQDQALHGNGLVVQSQQIDSYVHENGYKLLAMYEDCASGNDKRSMSDRSDFSAAVDHAKRSKAAIIVVGLDRVSRNAMNYREFRVREKVRIISTKAGETNSQGITLEALQKAQEIRERIADGTKQALAIKKREGQLLGNVDTLPAASLASIRVRRIASHMKVLEIRDFLAKHFHLQHATTKVVADQLNIAGILTSRGLQWNKESIRRMLRNAKEELALQNEPDDTEEDWPTNS